MKTIWTIISIIAVANVLALVGLVGWLKSSDRIDVARMREVRQFFAKTVTQQRAEEAEAKAKEEAAKKEAEEQAKRSEPPVRADEKLEVRLRESQADVVRLEGVRRDVQVLRDTLSRERQALDEERAKFEAERKAWAKMRDDALKLETDEQFKKTLGTLEALKPDKAKTTLDELIKSNNREQVVAYLNAMQDRTRTKIVDEFIKSDPKLAADLLERLRTKGQLAQAPPSTP